MHNLINHEWTTIAVTPITGWFNLFRLPGETESDLSECPAILLQECLQPGRSGGDERVTRAVFARVAEFGELEPAAEDEYYFGTEPASEIPAHLLPRGI